MKKNILKSLIVTGAVFTVLGCGGGSSVSGEEEVIIPEEQVSTLSQDLKDAITFMYNEEGLAYDVYMNIYQYHVDNNIPTANQLQQIASGEQSGSEEKHIAAVNDLAVKYDLNITQYPGTDVPYSVEGISAGNYSVPAINVLYETLYNKGKESEQDALEVGCMVEVVDIDDLEIYLGYAENSNASDVLEVFNFLITGSYKHYWAFNDALMAMKNSTKPEDGCCSLGTEYCHPEYPR